MNIQVMVIDDKNNDLEMIHDELCKIAVSKKINVHCDCFCSVPKEIDYDIVILDIDMPEMNGFELAKQIHEMNLETVIMFCTNYNELVFETFRLDTFYFIRKDQLHNDLSDALDKYISVYLRNKKQYILSSGNKIIKIPYTSIEWFEIQKNYVYIKTSEHEYRDRKTLQKLLLQIPGNMFVQVSRSELVNISFIKEIDEEDLILLDKTMIHIPLSRMKEVKKKYLEML